MARNAKRKRYRGIVLVVLVLWVGFHFAKTRWTTIGCGARFLIWKHICTYCSCAGEELEKKSNSGASPPEYIERVAREELGLVKPGGEVVYTLSAPLGKRS